MTVQGDAQSLAAALGKVPSGLFILTVRHGECETGMLASWVQQCSFEPPQVSFCVRRDRDVTAWLQPGAACTLNQLGEGQSHLISHFGKGFALGEPAFTGLNVERREGEAPILCDALACLLCRVTSRLSAGDHEVFVGTVVGGRLLKPEGRAWIHIRKNGLRY
jgi:flavin reductase (DIM6/NTAB) family NADH-FMN oxidoreductase RutF